MATIQISGFRELEAKLKELGSVAGTRAMRSAMFAATRPILDQAKSNARAAARSGALSLSMGRSFKVKAVAGLYSGLMDQGSKFVITIGPRLKHRAALAQYNNFYKRSRPLRGIYYGHLVEFDHKTRPRKVTGTWTRSSLDGKAAPFRYRNTDRSSQRIVPGKHILGNAIERRHQEAIAILATKLEAEIRKTLR